MNKKLIKLLFACAFLMGTFNTVTAQAYGSFPYNQPFTSGTQPTEISLLTPQNSGTNATTFTTNGMQLTSASNSQFGAVYINNKQFTSSNGIKIEFEYGMYGGTGADGISFFLFDAAVTTPVVGAKGAGLGYGYNRAKELYKTSRETGLTGGYLGIGLDAYGNFKSQVFQGERRVNGVTTVLSAEGSHVTLRGKQGTLDLTNGLGLGYTGYPVLNTQSTLNGATGAATINPATGAYTTGAGLADNFDLRTATFTTNPNNADYRKAFIELIPNGAGGYFITVKIQHGTTISTVIDNYWYRTSYVYNENANPDITDLDNSDVQGANTTYTLDTSAPSSFRIGFGASTGGLNDVHIIRGLKVTLPYAAISADDAFSMCANSIATVNPFTNDVAYAGLVTGPPASSSANVDPTSFQFIDAAGTAQGTSYTQTGVGTWTYNSSTQLVTLTPVTGYTGTASVKYNIKGLTSPYNDEGYRSESSTITATITACFCYKPATTGAGALPTKHGITSLGRAGAETSNGNWPMVRNGAWTALEAKTKGFVVNRMPTATTAQVTATPALKLGEPVNAAGTAAAIATPTKGMMFYDTTVNCMKINTDGTAAGWKCFNTQTCPTVN